MDFAMNSQMNTADLEDSNRIDSKRFAEEDRRREDSEEIKDTD